MGVCLKSAVEYKFCPHDILYILANLMVLQMKKWLKIKKIRAVGY